MPPEKLHMTAMELAHSLTEAEIATRISQIKSNVEAITDFTYSHRAMLVCPMISYDSAAIALSFLPAATESPMQQARYTYHHLRRDLYNLCRDAGAPIGSRYVVPSAHLTIGRFVNRHEFTKLENGQRTIDPQQVERWIAEIESINRWLQGSYWSAEAQKIRPEGIWTVGQEVGLDCQRGTLWYGDGTRVRLGKGF